MDKIKVGIVGCGFVGGAHEEPAPLENRHGQMFLKSLLLRMKELGVSQGELAARMKTSRPYVCKALHGEINITFASAARFARALHLDFLPQLVQSSTGERYASSRPGYQHFSSMGADPIECSSSAARGIKTNAP